MGKLSVIVITGNEERNLADCLFSVGWADEIVVVDSASEDRTVEIARRFTQKVYIRPWEGYSAAKSFALQQCTNDWVLWIDADERVTKELSAEIQNAVGTEVGDYVAFEFSRKSFFLGRWRRVVGAQDCSVQHRWSGSATRREPGTAEAYPPRSLRP